MGRRVTEFSTTANLVLACMFQWFSANRFILNLEKTNILKFVTNNPPYCALTIGHKEKYIEEAVHLKFLGIQIDNHLNWKNQIDLWGHPHDGTHSSSQLSRLVHLRLLVSKTALFRAPTSDSHYASQSYQLTNGTAGWPEEIRIKEGSPGCENS